MHGKLVFGALDAELDLSLASAQACPALLGFASEAVEEVVGVQGVMVEEDAAPGAGATGEGEAVGERGMAPADVVGVLGVGVLAVVDQKGGVASQGKARDPVLVELV